MTSIRTMNTSTTKLLVAGIVTAASVGLLVYISSTTASAKSKKDINQTNNGECSRVKQRTASASATATDNKNSGTDNKNLGKRPMSRDCTRQNFNLNDQKELHSKIEELDKKGKVLFKNKKVNSGCLLLLTCTATHRIVSVISIFFVLKIASSPHLFSFIANDKCNGD